MKSANPGPPLMSRREFIETGVYAIGGLVSLLLAVPLLGFLGAALTKNASEQWLPVCTLDQIASDRPTEFRVDFRGENSHVGFPDTRGVFVIRKGAEILAYTNVCTHMGCAVRWLDWREQILCPCHGGVYDRWGNLMGGPPPTNLPTYPTRIEGNTLLVSNRGGKG